MADSFFLENCTQSGPMLNSSDWMKVKLIDNGDGTFSYAMREPSNSYANITTAATTTVKSGAGVLKRIIVNKALINGVITIFDNLTATGAKIGTITLPTLTLLQQQLVLDFEVGFTNGLTIQTVTAQDITVIYR